MKSLIGVERFLQGAEYGLRRRPESTTAAAHRPVITISRQAGSGSHVVAEALVAGLQARDPEASPPWTMFDRDLVERVLKDHKFPTVGGVHAGGSGLRHRRHHRRAPGAPSPQVDAGSQDGRHDPAARRDRQRRRDRSGRERHHRSTRLRVSRSPRGLGPMTDPAPPGLPPRRSRGSGGVPPYERCRAEAIRGEVLREGYRRPALYHLVVNTDRVSYGEAARLHPRGGARASRPNPTRRCGSSCRRAGDLGTLSVWFWGPRLRPANARVRPARAGYVADGSAMAKIDIEGAPLARKPGGRATAQPIFVAVDGRNR